MLVRGCTVGASCLAALNAWGAPQTNAAIPPCTAANGPVASVVLHVTDASEAGLPHASLEVRCGSKVTTGLTNDRGELRISVFPGSYQLVVRATGFSDRNEEVVLPAPSGVLEGVMEGGRATDVVNVSADSGFVPYASNAGSKTNALLVEVPQSISIVSEQELQARGVITVNEALRYTPGVTSDEYGVEPRFDWLKIRGFDAQTFGIFRDGMRFNSLSGKLDPFELESVEILKGPSSVLYGEVPPGGLINQVTKQL